MFDVPQKHEVYRDRWDESISKTLAKMWLRDRPHPRYCRTKRPQRLEIIRLK